MKATIVRSDSIEQIGDLISNRGVSIKKDFPELEKDALVKELESRLSAEEIELPVTFDLKKFFLVINTVDELGDFYTAVT